MFGGGIAVLPEDCWRFQFLMLCGCVGGAVGAACCCGAVLLWCYDVVSVEKWWSARCWCRTVADVGVVVPVCSVDPAVAAVGAILVSWCRVAGDALPLVFFGRQVRP